jgi:hypothetical protein
VLICHLKNVVHLSKISSVPQASPSDYYVSHGQQAVSKDDYQFAHFLKIRQGSTRMLLV